MPENDRVICDRRWTRLVAVDASRVVNHGERQSLEKCDGVMLNWPGVGGRIADDNCAAEALRESVSGRRVAGDKAILGIAVGLADVMRLKSRFESAQRDRSLTRPALSEEVKAASHGLRVLLASAAEKGLRFISLSLPGIRGQSEMHGAFSRYQDGWNHTLSLLHEIRFDVESSGVRLGIEAASGGFLLSPLDARNLADEVNSPCIGFSLSEERIGSVGRMDDWLETLQHRVHVIRLSEIHSSAPRSSANGLVDDRIQTDPMADDRRLDSLLDSIRFDGALVIS